MTQITVTGLNDSVDQFVDANVVPTWLTATNGGV